MHNDNGETPLFCAAKFRHTNVVELLVKKYKAKVDIKNKNGETLLHVAAVRGD